MPKTATNRKNKSRGAGDYQPPCKRASGDAGVEVLANDQPAKVLANGIDTLYITCNVEWQTQTYKQDGQPTTQWFKRLAEDKARANNEERNEFPDVIRVKGFPAWSFNVSSWGAGGYNFMLSSQYMTWKMGDWMTPNSRPSIMIELRSEALWTFGVMELCRWCRLVIQAMGGVVVDMKPSRVDMCVDVAMHARDWKVGIMDHVVTRAAKDSMHRTRRKLSQIGWGAGGSKLSCRMYDKPMEIRDKSQKWWMFDVWGISPDDLTEKHRVIRVEFQVMRQKLTECGIDTMADLFREQDHLWSYFTRKWLMIVKRLDKRSRRQDADWWQVVQHGYRGSQTACALVPAKAVKAKEDQLTAQVIGCAISVLACQRKDIEEAEPIDVIEAVNTVMRQKFSGPNAVRDIQDKIRARLARNSRAELKLQDQQNEKARRYRHYPVGQLHGPQPEPVRESQKPGYQHTLSDMQA